MFITCIHDTIVSYLMYVSEILPKFGKIDTMSLYFPVDAYVSYVTTVSENSLSCSLHSIRIAKFSHDDKSFLKPYSSRVQYVQ